MEYLKSGFSNVDKSMGGLKRGEIYFISAANRETAKNFAASLCASINSVDDAYRSILYTDSPVPYCHCQHIHFVSADNAIEFLHVDLSSGQSHELSKTDVYFFEDFDLLSTSSIKIWPSDKDVRRQLYKTYLQAIRDLAQKYGAVVVLTDQLYENDRSPGEFSCDFPELRYGLSEGTFHLLKQENETLYAQYINHQDQSRFSFRLKSELKEISQNYTIYSEYGFCASHHE